MLLIALKSALVLGLGLGLATLLRRRSTALRRGVLAATVLGVLLLPALSAMLPRWRAAELSAGAADTPEQPLSAQPFRWVSVPRDTAPHGSTRAAHDGAGSVAGVLIVVLVAGWALGAVVLLGRLGAGWLETRWMVRRAKSDREWEQSLAVSCVELGLRRQPWVRLSEDADTPLVTGILRPVVLVPTSMRSWPPERRRLVLLHELAHVAAHDCALLVASQLVCALHWPNPLAWRVRRELCRLGEGAADDAVLRAGVRASSYAQGLLDAARGARPVPLGAMAMARQASLERRVRAVLAADGRREPLTRRGAVLLAGFALAATTLVACVHAQTDREPASVDTKDAQAVPGDDAPSAVPQVAPGDGAQSAGSHVAFASNTPSGAPQVAPGDDVDPRVQAIVDDETARTRTATGATSVTVVVLDAASGRLLGVHDADRVVVPGSTIKPFTVAAALAAGLAADARFDGEGGRWAHDGTVLTDAEPYGQLDVTDILVRSSNIGGVKIAERVGPGALHRFLARIGLGRGLPETTTDPLREAYVATGEGLTATPRELATAYTVLADDGVLARPSGAHERVLPAAVARTVRGMLEHVVTDDAGTGHRARIEGVRVAGKTGTAGLIDPAGGFREHGVYASFAGIVPADRPALVVLVGVVDPQGDAYGGKVAAPAFARIARRVLALR